MRFELRNMEIYEKRIRGASLAALAGEYDLTEQRISGICAEQRRAMPALDREAMVAASFEQLEYLREKVLEMVEMRPAPVTFGEMGDLLRDEDGSVVRDYKLRTTSIELARKLNESTRKLLGMDAPVQAEVKASVQYEVVGLDPEALT